jgi:hypothetical protein
MSSKLSTYFRVFRPSIYFQTLNEFADETVVAALNGGICNLYFTLFTGHEGP